MTRILPALLALFLAAAVTACGTEDAAPPADATAGDATVTFDTAPDPPRMGENVLEVSVSEDGMPVTDADVTVELVMPAMPEHNMPEMRERVPLQHEADGRYRGEGNVSMAGTWNVTVTATRGGQPIASEQFSLTAQE